MRRLEWVGLSVLAAAACTPGTSALPSGGGTGGGGAAAAPTGTAKVTVDLKTGDVQISDLGEPTSRAAFGGSKFAFTSAKLLEINAELSVQRMIFTYRNNSGVTLGQGGKIRFLFSDIGEFGALNGDLTSYSTLDLSASATRPEDVWTDGNGVIFSVSAALGQVLRSTGGGSSAIQSGLVNPKGIVGVGDDLYVTAAHRVWKMRKDGTGLQSLAGSGTAGSANGSGASAQFNEPAGIAVGPDGALYVCDQANNSIRRVALDGTVTTVATGLGSPVDLAPFQIDGFNYLAFSSYSRNRVSAVDLTSGNVFDIAGTGAGGYTPGTGATSGLGQPYGIAAQGGTIYFSLASSGVIGQLSLKPGASPKSQGEWAVSSLVNHSGQAVNSPFGGVRGLASDSKGAVWAADFGGNKLGRLTGRNRFFVEGPWGGTGGNANTSPIEMAQADERLGRGVFAFYGPETLAPDAVGELGPLSFVIPKGVEVFSFFITVEAPVEESFGIPAALNAGSPEAFVSHLGGADFDTGFNSFEARDGVGVDARFRFLHSVAADDFGNAYLTDFTGRRVIRYNGQTGRFTTIINPNFKTNTTGDYFENGAAQALSSPGAIACTSDGKVLYFSDGRAIIRAEFLSEAGSDLDDPSLWSVGLIAGDMTLTGDADGVGGIARFGTISGITMDSQLRRTGRQGTLYIADRFNNKIKALRDFEVSSYFGSGTAGNGASDVAGPSAVLIGPDGLFYVAEADAARVSIIRENGSRATVAGSDIGASGYQDTENYLLTPSLFRQPYSLATDGLRIYVGDQRKIRRMDSAYKVKTVAGVDSGDGYSNGAGDIAMFSGYPRIAFLSPDTMIVAEATSVRKISRYIK